MTENVEHIPPPANSQSALMELLQFNESDLAANRSGQMSPAQRAAFRQSWQRGIVIRMILLILGIVSASSFLYAGQELDSPAFTLIGIALTILNALVVGLATQAYLRYSGDTRRQDILVVEGSAKRILRINQRARAAAYFVKIGDDEIRVAKPVFNAFVEGRRYRIYRAPVSKTVLSVEAVSHLPPKA